MQVGVHHHLEVENSKLSHPDSAYAWRYLNHSCAPNIHIEGLEVFAIKPIKKGTELCFNYNSTEWEIASPFQCRCGKCNNAWIQGYKFLTESERDALYAVANHLKMLINEKMD